MKIFSTAMVILALLALQQRLSAAEDAASPLAAVFPLRSELVQGSEREASLAFVDLFRSGLETAGLELVERERLEAVIAELELGASGAIDVNTAPRLGRLLQADYLFVGSIRGTIIDRLLQVRAVRVADGSVAWAGQANGSGSALIDQALSLADAAARQLAAGSAERLLEAEQRPLAALRHLERAQSLRAQDAPAAAATESLLALRHDPTLGEAELGFIEALAAAGQNELAAAEARALLMLQEDHPARARLESLARPAPGAVQVGAPPAASTTPNLILRTQQQLIDSLERLARGGGDLAALAEADLVAAWSELGRQHQIENRDHAALAAYREALRRVWALRQHSGPAAVIAARALPDAAKHDPQCGAIARLLDLWTHYDLRPTVPEGLTAALRACRTSGGLPSNFVRPPPLRLIPIPISDRLLIDGSFLLHLDWAALAVDAEPFFMVARLGQDPFTDRLAPVLQDWVAAEADTVHARADVAWIPQGSPGMPVTGGRPLPLGLDQRPREALLRAARQRAFSHGLAIRHAGDRDYSQLEIHAGVPDPGAPEATWDPNTLLEQAAFDLLEAKGSVAASRLHRLAPLVRNSSDKAELEALLALCREVQP